MVSKKMLSKSMSQSSLLHNSKGRIYKENIVKQNDNTQPNIREHSYKRLHRFQFDDRSSMNKFTFPYQMDDLIITVMLFGALYPEIFWYPL